MGNRVTTLIQGISGSKVERLGFPFYLILFYLIVEYARPANPMKISMIISVLLFLNWVALPKKQWSPQIICFYLLLGVIGVTGPFALNNYAIWMGFRTMTVQLAFICVPIIHFALSLRKISIFMNTLIAVLSYVAIYGILHGGRGPGGHIGDQNDLALALNSVIPFAFFSLLFAKNLMQKALFGCAFGLMVASVVATLSRGGFVGLVPVLLYCFVFAPKKAAMIAIGIALTFGVWMYTPDNYWTEMGTIQETVEGSKQENRDNRYEFWEIAGRMFYDHPILGVGLGNFPYNASRYQSKEQFDRLERVVAGQAVHSLYFSMLSELGLSGFLIFFAILMYNFRYTSFIISTAKNWGKDQGHLRKSMPAGESEEFFHDLEKARYYAHALRASMCGYLVSGIFLSVFTYPHFWLVTALIVTLNVIVTNRLQEATAKHKSMQDIGTL